MSTQGASILQNYQVPSLPQLQGGDPVFWRNELSKLSKSINLLNGQTAVTAVTTGTNYSIRATDRVLNSTVALTGPTTWTLPPSGQCQQGQKLIITTGGINATDTLTLAASSGDQLFINGATVPSVTWGQPAVNATFVLVRTFWCQIEDYAGFIPISEPQGRLTNASQTPVITANTTSTTCYYTRYKGQQIPLWTGSSFVMTDFGGELSQALSDTTNSPAATVALTPYDLFVWLKNGVPTLSRGPAWSSNTARSMALVYNAGLLVNSATVTNGPLAERGTYVGTIYTNSANQLQVLVGGQASGGSPIFCLIWNMYNRIDFQGQSIDTGTTYTYTSSTWRLARASSANVAYFVSGLPEDGISAQAETSVQMVGVNGAFAQNALALDSTITAASATQFEQQNGTSVYASTMTLATTVPPQLGFHNICLMEASDNTNANTFDFVGDNSLTFLFRC